MPDLLPFDAEARCPKCGHDDVDIRYVARSGHASWMTPACGLGAYSAPEHLDRRCERCHYVWAEAIIALAAHEGEA